MIAERKMAANRSNNRRGGGPRTAAGKAKASRNAMRHGLAALIHREPVSSEELARLARSICGNDHDPVLFNQARVIAETELALRAIREQQMAVVERLREPTAIALAKGDNSFTLAKARVLQAWLAHREIKTLLPIVLERYKDRISDENGAEEADFEFGIVPVRLKALLDEPASIEEEKEEKGSLHLLWLLMRSMIPDL